MKKLIGTIAATVGSTAGWYATAKLGFMTAFIFSTIVGGVAAYYAVKWVKENLE